MFNVGFRSPDQEPMERNVDLSTLVPRLATVLANAPQEVLQELENPFQTLQRFGRTANLLEQLDDPLELLNPLGSPFDPFEATVVSELLNELDRFWLLGDVESVPRVLGVGNWREHAQALALSDRDVSEFGADIDFGKLREAVTERNVPDAGILSLLYPSRYYLGEGTDTDHDVLEGRIQPYSAYVPADLEEPAPMVMRLHSLSCSYTQYAVYTPNPVKRISEPNNAVVLMPQARDPGRWYQREAELDVFEAWRDLEGRIDIDRSRVTLGGYSMGGFGTCVLAAQCPDLFGRGFSVVGPPTEDPIECITGGLATAPPSLTTNLFGGEGAASCSTSSPRAPRAPSRSRRTSGTSRCSSGTAPGTRWCPSSRRTTTPVGSGSTATATSSTSSPRRRTSRSASATGGPASPSSSPGARSSATPGG